MAVGQGYGKPMTHKFRYIVFGVYRVFKKTASVSVRTLSGPPAGVSTWFCSSAAEASNDKNWFQELVAILGVN